MYADFIAGDFNFNPDDYNIIKSISYKDFLNVISQDDLPIEYEQSLYWNIHNAIQEKRPLMLSWVSGKFMWIRRVKVVPLSHE